MANRQTLLGMGTRRGERLVRELAESIHEERLAAGLTLRELGTAARVSTTQVWRIEHGAPPYPNLIQAARICQLLGLDLSVRCFPAGPPLRDAAHLRLVHRLVARTPAVRWRLESAIPLAGDLRAWDMAARVEDAWVGVAAETRLRDVQALLRREHAKMRDSGVGRLLLLVAATHANRSTLRQIRESLRPELPLGTRAMLAALQRGRDPGGSGIVLL